MPPNDHKEHIILSISFNVVHLFSFSVCMFLEDSVAGLQVWQELYLSLVNKVSDLFSTVLEQGSLGDGPLCYAAVKVPEEQKGAQVRTCSFHITVDAIWMSLQVCLQMFQLLSSEIAALVWDKEHKSPTVQTILQALLGIILGKVF